MHLNIVCVINVASDFFVCVDRECFRVIDPPYSRSGDFYLSTLCNTLCFLPLEVSVGFA